MEVHQKYYFEWSIFHLLTVLSYLEIWSLGYNKTYLTTKLCPPNHRILYKEFVLLNCSTVFIKRYKMPNGIFALSPHSMGAMFWLSFQVTTFLMPFNIFLFYYNIKHVTDFLEIVGLSFEPSFLSKFVLMFLFCLPIFCSFFFVSCR